MESYTCIHIKKKDFPSRIIHLIHTYIFIFQILHRLIQQSFKLYLKRTVQLNWCFQPLLLVWGVICVKSNGSYMQDHQVLLRVCNVTLLHVND